MDAAFLAVEGDDVDALATLVTQCRLSVDARRAGPGPGGAVEAYLARAYDENEARIDQHRGCGSEEAKADGGSSGAPTTTLSSNLYPTLLHECAYHNAAGCAAYLLKHRCDPKPTDNNGSA